MNTMIRELSRKQNAYGGRAIKLKRTMRMSLAIIVTFIVCYLPTVIVYVTMASITDTLWIRSFMAPLSEISIMANSLLNPLIYCFRLQAVRGEIVKLLYRARQIMWITRRRKNRVTPFKTAPVMQFSNEWERRRVYQHKI